VSSNANTAPSVTATTVAAPSTLAPQPASAGTANDPAAPDTPIFRTTAHQVLFDVVVDKKNGDPVPDLSRSDFSVNENGKPQAIDFFEEHSAAASAPLAQVAMPPLPPGAVTNVPAAAPSAALYVFLLDSLNAEPQDQVFIREQVLSFLHKVDPGTHVAVFSLGSSLRLLQGFTSDSAALVAAVSGKEAERDAMAQNRSDNADDARHLSELASMRASQAKIEAMGKAQAAAHGYSFGARASMTFEALDSLARYLEGIPGRKNLIWFSSSFPVIFFPAPGQLDQLKNNPGYLNHVQQTANLFTLSKIAVYPVSGAGVANSNIGMADSADAGSAGGTGHFGTAANPTSSLTSEALNIASALTDIDNALRKIVHDSDVFYTVGYSPTDSATDSNYRRIDVKVAGGKYKLAYRQGYNTSGPDASPAENPLTPLLQPGLPGATGIFYGVSVERKPGQEQDNSHAASAGQNPQLTGHLTRYTVSFAIRAQDVSFGQAANGNRIARLLIGVKAYGKDGAALNWQASREAANLTPAQYTSIVQTGLPIRIDLDLPANTPAQLVTAVYDWDTTRSGTLEIPLHP
jgi:VWFA-related protein